MSIRNTLLWLTLAALISACGESDQAPAPDKTVKATAVVRTASCIADYAQQPCDLLTTELVQSVYGRLPDDIKTEQTLVTSSCQHSWPGDRTQLFKMGSVEVEAPLNDRVAISWIAKKDDERAEEWFRQTYRTLSDEEKVATIAALDKELEKQAAGLSADQKDLASRFGSDMINASRYESVDGVGTVAAWDASPRGYTLKVLDVDSEFGIEADISDESGVNRDLAIALAQAVMAACP